MLAYTFFVLQARKYIESLPYMPPQDLKAVFRGANPLGKSWCDFAVEKVATLSLLTQRRDILGFMANRPPHLFPLALSQLVAVSGRWVGDRDTKLPQGVGNHLISWGPSLQ